jgi:hypothetical protein
MVSPHSLQTVFILVIRYSPPSVTLRLPKLPLDMKLCSCYEEGIYLIAEIYVLFAMLKAELRHNRKRS